MRLSLEAYHQGILNGDRVVLARAITLVESDLTEDQFLAEELLTKLLGRTGHSIRIGITGVPGAGKSTFIEAFGKHILMKKKKLAVLTVDPSSQISKGSILGDKTRMEALSKNPLAFIRPTATGTALGGVAGRTREALLLCEAAGYEVILVETVGVGQSEVTVKSIVDFFLLLMLPGAGDELQGMKKGVIEMADALVINKTDGDNIKKAHEAKTAYQHAFHLLPPSPSGWNPKVLTCSSITGEGIGEVWNLVENYLNSMTQSGYLMKNREQQNITGLKESFVYLLQDDIRKRHLHHRIQSLEESVKKNQIDVNSAARLLLKEYHQAILGSNS